MNVLPLLITASLVSARCASGATLYIDLTYSDTEAGTLDQLHNAWTAGTIPSENAYLQKRRTAMLQIPFKTNSKDNARKYMENVL